MGARLQPHLCPVCGEGRVRVVLTNCGHVFCAGCVVLHRRMRQRSCPICRTPFSDSEMGVIVPITAQALAKKVA